MCSIFQPEKLFNIERSSIDTKFSFSVNDFLFSSIQLLYHYTFLFLRLFSLTMFWAHIFIITKYTRVSKEKRKARKWNTVSGTNSFHSHTHSFFILFTHTLILSFFILLHSSMQLFLSIDNNTLYLKRRK